jgi:hypothetical protein
MKRFIQLDLNLAVVGKAQADLDFAAGLALDADHLRGAGFHERGTDRQRAGGSSELVVRGAARGAELLVEVTQLQAWPEPHLDHRTVWTHDIDLPVVAVASRLLGHTTPHPVEGGNLGSLGSFGTRGHLRPVKNSGHPQGKQR